MSDKKKSICHGYLHNGLKAWGMPRRIGPLFLSRAYLPPPGWQVTKKLEKNSWDKHGNGYYVRRG